MSKPLADLSDDHILALLQQSACLERGFRLLVEKYQERLYWHVRQLVVDHDDANDVVQNCFLKAYRGIGNFRGYAGLYTWLYRIATNEAITHLNQRKRKSATSINDEAAVKLANQLEADAYFDGDELQIRLQQALQTLPEKQRVVFNLRYYEEMPYNDMAKILDTSAGALKASYHHAVKKIENYFKNIEL